MEDVIFLIPPRSHLFRLAPEGEGTGYIESLTSYTARLAAEHGMSTGELISKEITPLLNSTYLTNMAQNGGTGFYKSSSMVLGEGKAAQNLADLLEKLTCRQGLQQLTAICFQNVFPDRHLVRLRRAWCPCCYEDWSRTGKIIYDPLLWALQAVNACPKHKVALIDVCQSCGNQSYQLERKLRPGYCPHCSSWLGGHIEEGNLEFYSSLIEVGAGIALEIIEYFGGEKRPARVSEFLRSATNELCAGNAAEFGRFIGKSKATLAGWCHGKNLMPFTAFVEVCVRIGAAPVEALSGRYIKIKDYSDNCGVTKKKTRDKTIQLENIQKLINQEVSICPLEPISLKNFANKIGVSTRFLQNRFPDGAREISRRYVTYQTERRLGKDSLLLNEAMTITKQLLSNGIVPSRCEVETVARTPYLLRQTRVRKLWQQYLNETLETFRHNHVGY